VSSFTVLGAAGPLQVGYAPGKVWVAGAFLSVAGARELARLTDLAADAADADPGEPAPEHPATPGLFL
jgi:hypothetical protein